MQNVHGDYDQREAVDILTLREMDPDKPVIALGEDFPDQPWFKEGILMWAGLALMHLQRTPKDEEGNAIIHFPEDDVFLAAHDSYIKGAPVAIMNSPLFDFFEVRNTRTKSRKLSEARQRTRSGQ